MSNYFLNQHFFDGKQNSIKAKSMNRIKKEKKRKCDNNGCNVSLLTLLKWIRFFAATCNFEFTGPAVYRKDWKRFPHLPQFLEYFRVVKGGSRAPVHGFAFDSRLKYSRSTEPFFLIFRNLCLAHVNYSPLSWLRIFKISTGQCKVSYVPSPEYWEAWVRSLRRQLA